MNIVALIIPTIIALIISLMKHLKTEESEEKKPVFSYVFSFLVPFVFTYFLVVLFILLFFMEVNPSGMFELKEESTIEFVKDVDLNISKRIDNYEFYFSTNDDKIDEIDVYSFYELKEDSISKKLEGQNLYIEYGDENYFVKRTYLVKKGFPYILRNFELYDFYVNIEEDNIILN